MKGSDDKFYVTLLHTFQGTVPSWRFQIGCFLDGATELLSLTEKDSSINLSGTFGSGAKIVGYERRVKDS
ncbi:hypothetical protein P4J32_28985 [Bacillus cereus]|uniref:hypothetical protein n=1 Tax=Bacillus thuringiensis TaxID=1428 RepID=UPI0012F83952|nr:hypothetical protein [Bacillus thuringiensis]MEB9661597.1 hypothetical protein [Bacillus cereus]